MDSNPQRSITNLSCAYVSNSDFTFLFLQSFSARFYVLSWAIEDTEYLGNLVPQPRHISKPFFDDVRISSKVNILGDCCLLIQAWVRWALWWHCESCVSAQSEGAIKEILKGAHVVPDIGVDALIDAELEEMEQDECSAEQWRCRICIAWVYIAF